MKQTLTYWVTAAVLTATPSAFALPLLAQNAAQNTGSALTLYPDSDNPNLFYFFPNSSAFAVDTSTNLPAFGFTYWGLNPASADAGAFMVFSMRLHSDQDQAKALDAAIASGKRVAVLPVQSSTIGLTATRSPGAGGTPGTSAGGSAQTAAGALPLGKFFEEFNFAERAGRAEDEVAVNSVLTGLGAKVFKAAIEAPALIKMDYCYQVQGLGPNFDARIDIDWKSVYDDYQLHSSGGSWWFRWQVDAQIEKLKRSGAVRIAINGGDAKDEEYVRKVADEVAAKLFVPELHAQPTSGGDGGGFSFTRMQLKVTQREELKEQHWILVRRELVTKEFCVPLTLTGLSRYKDQLVHNADATL